VENPPVGMGCIASSVHLPTRKVLDDLDHLYDDFRPKQEHTSSDTRDIVTAMGFPGAKSRFVEHTETISLEHWE
jgi:hypothetical protein